MPSRQTEEGADPARITHSRPGVMPASSSAGYGGKKRQKIAIVVSSALLSIMGVFWVSDKSNVTVRQVDDMVGSAQPARVLIAALLTVGLGAQPECLRALAPLTTGTAQESPGHTTGCPCCRLIAGPSHCNCSMACCQRQVPGDRRTPPPRQSDPSSFHGKELLKVSLAWTITDGEHDWRVEGIPADSACRPAAPTLQSQHVRLDT